MITVSLGIQAWADLTYGTFTWAQLPGYFTPLANIAGIVALVAAALAGSREPDWVASLRVNAATYLVVVGVVYWTMLAPYTSPKFPLVNAILHGGAGLILALDWLLIGGARLPRWRMLWTVMTLPAAWMGYLLVRAFHDGWVPYPFLDPARGAVAIAQTVGAIVLAGVAVAALLRLLAAAGPRARRQRRARGSYAATGILSDR
ncbi:Pr6Pr family membrane protein [Demequina zhanjiangensis]|uniref:Pr6Pr family membrane protein n=1 Tax=Demequina zhanjiangensis TaxID=3051659 RepID=A0ABT8G2T9_9MICO|nr:Pr6Pr family membrane protein [Demequina sp. SYSU T00b26]MDN4473244.1 Pr6Pr family membrane protein [Demequina sp. SYSU T00b26]